MKKVLYSLIATLSFMAIAQAQCPTFIADGGSGGTYNLTLMNPAQCTDFPFGSIITIKGQSYGVADCGDGSGPIILELTFQSGTPIVLATNGPLTIPVGASSCVFNSSGRPIVLPIELIEFNGTPSVSGNVLTWTTVREVSSRGFQVERLVSDKTWLPLTFVKSKGANGTYTFTDYNPLPTSYYRLLQLDNDGKETLSKVVSVVQTGKGKGLTVYPNPVSNVLTIAVERNDIPFYILNLIGQQVLTGKTSSGGRGLDVSALPQGAYFLKVGVEQVKFIKQ